MMKKAAAMFLLLVPLLSCQSDSVPADQNASPLTPSIPTGPSNGIAAEDLGYSTTATDPDGDMLEYRFDWGDGSTSAWGSASQNHSWYQLGDFSIRAQARDEHGRTSTWSAGLPVNITFGPPRNLSENSGSSSGQEFCLYGSYVYVVWQDTTSDPQDIYFRRSSDGGITWDPIINLSDNPGISRFAQIAVDGSGVFVVWGDYTTTFVEQDILFRRSTDHGATFGATKKVSTTPGMFPRICSGGGGVHIIWTAGGVAYARSNDLGSTFETERFLVAGGGGAEQVTSLGNTVLVFWTDGSSVCYRRSTDSGVVFGDKIDLYPAGNNVEVAQSESGIFLTWENIGAPGNISFCRSTDSGATFGSIQSLSMGGNGGLPQIAASGGNVYVTWIEDDPSGVNDVYLRGSTSAGAAFGDAIVLSPETVEAEYPVVAASGNYAFVAWQRFEPGAVGVRLSYSSNGGLNFMPAEDISSDGTSSAPAIASTGQEVYIVWRSTTPGPGDIYFLRLRK